MQPCKIYEEAAEVDSQLNSLGLNVGDLLEVLRHISLTDSSMTPDHPSWGIAIGIASEGVFALRSVLKTKGWTREEENGFALTLHPENLLAINIAKGDDGVGDSENPVSTRSSKGICTEAAVRQNQLWLDLPEPALPDDSHSEKRPTWYLLYRKADGLIRGELSLPRTHKRDEPIIDWAKRIILPSQKFDEVHAPASGFEPGTVEISVKRKSK